MSTRSVELALLRERARALALPAPTLGLGEQSAELMVFTRASVRYALEVRYVRELGPLPEYVSLPFAPPACLGLAAVRGELVSVFDLAALDAHAPNTQAPRLLLVCGDPARELGLALDEAHELVARGAALERPPADSGGPVLGLDPRGFLLLDGEALLSDPRLTIDPQHPETAP